MNSELKKGVDDSLKGVENQLKGYTGRIRNEVEKASSAVTTRMVALGSMLGNLAAQGVAGMARLVTSAIGAGLQTVASMEQAQIAFETLLKSQKGATDFLASLKEF